MCPIGEVILLFTIVKQIMLVIIAIIPQIYLILQLYIGDGIFTGAMICISNLIVYSYLKSAVRLDFSLELLLAQLFTAAVLYVYESRNTAGVIISQDIFATLYLFSAVFFVIARLVGWYREKRNRTSGRLPARR
jgi:hypothetical protein